MAARRQLPADNEQRLQQTGAARFGKAGVVPAQRSILPSSMAPSGEGLGRPLVLISMGRHGHGALSHIVPCTDNGSSAVGCYNAFIPLKPASS